MCDVVAIPSAGKIGIEETDTSLSISAQPPELCMYTATIPWLSLHAVYMYD